MKQTEKRRIIEATINSLKEKGLLKENSNSDFEAYKSLNIQKSTEEEGYDHLNVTPSFMGSTQTTLSELKELGNEVIGFGYFKIKKPFVFKISDDEIDKVREFNDKFQSKLSSLSKAGYFKYTGKNQDDGDVFLEKLQEEMAFFTKKKLVSFEFETNVEHY